MAQVITALKMLKAAMLAKFGRFIPIKVMHYTTYRCNFNCDYCYTKELKSEKELSTKQIKDVMDFFKKQGTLVWSLIGGEPLIRHDIGEIIRYGKKLGFLVNIATNGYFVKKKLEELREIDNVFLSLEGPKEIHDAISGNDSFDLVIDAVKDLKKMNKTVILNTVVSKENHKHLDALNEISKKYSCYVNLTPVYSLNEDSSKYQLSPEELQEAHNKIKEFKKKNRFIACSDQVFNRTILHSQGKIKKFQKRCFAGKLFCTLTPDGKVAPCYPLLSKDWPSGEKKGYKEALKSLPDFKDCDCNINCFYSFNELFALNPSIVTESLLNILSGRRIF